MFFFSFFLFFLFCFFLLTLALNLKNNKIIKKHCFLGSTVRLLFSITIIYSNCIAVYFPFLDLYSLYKPSSYIYIYII